MNERYLCDNSKFIVGERFSHHKYGIGTCLSVQGDSIIIDFGELQGKKNFYFPDAIIDKNILWVDEEKSEESIDSKRRARSGQASFKPKPIKIITPQSIISDRKIYYFVHYTRIDNIVSILENGLCSVDYMKTHNIKYFSNDIHRLDGRTDAISLSVSFPNYKNFWKARNGENRGWCVILLDPVKVVDLECGYFCTNAANSNWRTIDWERLKTPEVFELMFYEKGRSDKIPRNYPTDPQAEIMVKDRIPSDYIKSIVIHPDDRFDKSIITCRYVEDEDYFKPRCDVAEWSKTHSAIR